MEIKDHVKGVLLAILSAGILLFVIGFFVGSEVRVAKSAVVKNNADSVFTFVSTPQNFQKWIQGADEFNVEYLPENKGLQYIGLDENLHQFKYKAFTKTNGLEITYKRNGEDMAIYKMKIIPKTEGAVIEYVKVWRISENPLAKIVSLGLDEDLEAGMAIEFKAIKKILDR